MRFRWAVFLMFLAAPLRAEHPYRHIDGRQLADVFTDIILSQPATSNRSELVIPADYLKRLAVGNEFFPIEDPRRIRLKKWLLDQPDASVMPQDLLIQAFRQSEGNVARALILCWDTLREGWKDPRRNTFEHILKLEDISGELREFDGNYHEVEPRDRNWIDRLRKARFTEVEASRGDNFSLWYHFFGMAIDGYVSHVRKGGTVRLRPRILNLIQQAGFTPNFVDARKRSLNDLEGAWFGDRLAGNLSHFTDRQVFRKARPNIGKSVLIDSPRRLKGYELLARGEERQHARDFGTERFTRSGPTLMERILRLRELSRKSDEASFEEIESLISLGEMEGSPLPLLAKPRSFDEIWRLFVSQYAVRMLGRRPDAVSRRRLLQLADSPRPHLRIGAIQGLADGKDPGAFAALKRLFEVGRNYRSVLVGGGALDATEGLPDSDRLNSLFRSLLMDEDPGVRSAAASYYMQRDKKDPITLQMAQKEAEHGLKARNEHADWKTKVITNTIEGLVRKSALPLPSAVQNFACKKLGHLVERQMAPPGPQVAASEGFSTLIERPASRSGRRRQNRRKKQRAALKPSQPTSPPVERLLPPAS